MIKERRKLRKWRLLLLLLDRRNKKVHRTDKGNINSYRFFYWKISSDNTRNDPYKTSTKSIWKLLRLGSNHCPYLIRKAEVPQHQPQYVTVSQRSVSAVH